MAEAPAKHDEKKPRFPSAFFVGDRVDPVYSETFSMGPMR